ncbi:M23 family metallopeptidase [Niveispirillum sp. KHB5.9]|uniref:M23 family metallopeptidase n=1 Tax=Niveispirillum sp. KHB5.9 TaxID=3400269 RepID=UPI003A88D8C4
MKRFAIATIALAALGGAGTAAFLHSTSLSTSKTTLETTPALASLDAQQGLSAAPDAWGDSEQAADPVERRLVNLGRGETLMQVLLEADVPQPHAQEAVAALKAVYDPRRMKSGQPVEVMFDRTGGEGRFVGFEFQPAVERSVSVSFNGVRFQAAETAKKLARRAVAAQGEIRSSLFESGRAAGVPMSVLTELIRNYSYDVDFQRDIQPGDRFEVLYEQVVTEDGEVASGGGNILYASLTLSGKEQAIYRYEDSQGIAEFFNTQGSSIRKALLKTPIDGARLSSGFGMRRHPVLGYSKMHKGVDFAAPTGTPIYAAGAGVVDEVGPNGSYGNYIRIRHNGEISTAYAHMSRFGAGMRKGARVAQGDVIGYVGTTGRSTGAHLHYEIVKAGQQVNPLSVAVPTGRNLDGKELARFKGVMASLQDRFEAGGDAVGEGVGLVSATPRAAKPSKSSCDRKRGC